MSYSIPEWSPAARYVARVTRRGVPLQRMVRWVRVFVPVAFIVLLRVPCIVTAGLAKLFEMAAEACGWANAKFGRATPGLDKRWIRAGGKGFFLTPREYAHIGPTWRRLERIQAARRLVHRASPSNTQGDAPKGRSHGGCV